MERFLPEPFRPKIQGGYAIAGICLIRLEQIRPAGLPGFLGLSSEYAAHRVAVWWEESTGIIREGVFIPRRDTGSRLSHLAGGRLFPGQHRLADFAVEDDGAQVSMSIRSRDGRMSLALRAHECEELPASSCFTSLAEASAFFESGNLGYSPTRNRRRFDGIRLQTESWQVRPLAVEHINSSFFADRSIFPSGCVAFDHALIMRDIPHEWHRLPDMFSKRKARPAMQT